MHCKAGNLYCDLKVDRIRSLIVCGTDSRKLVINRAIRYDECVKPTLYKSFRKINVTYDDGLSLYDSQASIGTMTTFYASFYLDPAVALQP